MAQKLNLPEFDYKISKHGDEVFIFDIIRKKNIVLTPEEWVRQHFIHFLINEKKYPKGLISVEKGVKKSIVQNRTDIVVFNRFGNPWMIVECKSPDVELSKDTFYQALRYHLNLNANFIVVTNGLEHYCINLLNDSFEFMDDLPEFV